ncbi:MAG TPA: hypothetical protein VHN99_09615, partial [Deinococcales bacterium]|nr:hypothetical protein [Deinococcales bacterium]
MTTIGPFTPTRPLELSQPGPVDGSLGLDGVTGLPVFIFTAPTAAQTASNLPFHANLAERLLVTTGGERTLSVYSAAPGWSRVNPPVAGRRLVAIGRDVLKGLQALHQAGLAHGGLQPGVLLQRPEGTQLLGAGLPWTAGANDATDLRAWADLMTTLAAPHALDQLPNLKATVAAAREREASAAGLLDLLDRPEPQEAPAAEPAAPPEAAKPATQPEAAAAAPQSEATDEPAAVAAPEPTPTPAAEAAGPPEPVPASGPRAG